MLQLTELGWNNPFWFQTHKYWHQCCRAHCCRQMWNKTNFVSLILSVLQMLVFTTLDFHFNKKLSRCYCCSSHIFSATIFKGIKLILSFLLKERIEKGLCSFPSHSPFQFLPHFPTRLPQWHGSVASVISRLRGEKKSPIDCFFFLFFFFCIVAPHVSFIEQQSAKPPGLWCLLCSDCFFLPKMKPIRQSGVGWRRLPGWHPCSSWAHLRNEWKH